MSEEPRKMSRRKYIYAGAGVAAAAVAGGLAASYYYSTQPAPPTTTTQVLTSTRETTKETTRTEVSTSTLPPTTVETTVEKTVTGPVTLVLAHDKPPWDEPIKSVFESFTKKTQIGFKTVPYTADIFVPAMQQVFGTPKAPDLFTWWHGFRLRQIAEGNYALDLSEVWDKRIASGEYTTSLRDSLSVEGKPIAAPLNSTYAPCWYSKTIFQEHELEPPKTWDEFMSICETLKNAGIVPISHVWGAAFFWLGTIWWFEELIIRIDPQYYDDLMIGRAEYTDDRMKKALEHWKEMIEKGYFGNLEEVAGGLDLMAETVAGRIAMTLVSDWWSGNYSGAGGNWDDVGFFVVPNIEPKAGNVIIQEIGPMLVSASTPYVDQAVQAIDYWMSPEAQEPWCKGQKFIPPNLKVDRSFVPRNKIELLDMITAGNFRLATRFWEATEPNAAAEILKALEGFEFNLNVSETMTSLQEIADKYFK